MSDDRVPASTDASTVSALEMAGVAVERSGRLLLADIDWDVAPDQRWLVLGANGSGKTTLIRLASMYEHPTRGVVRVLGEELGRTDVRTLRRHIGLASASLAAQLRGELTALDVVMTAKYAALEPWWHHYDDADRARAHDCLERMGVDGFAARPLAGLSSGEQQRVFLARSLMTDPGIVLLDEPSARLDLGGREHLVRALSELARDASAPAMVLVTHHVDEIPPGMTHVMMLRAGRVTAAGPLDATLTAANLSECFEMDLALERRDGGRFSAWARRPRPD